METQLDERRQSQRLQREDRLVIRTVTLARDAYMTTLYCSTIDVSPKGLQLKLDHAIPIGYLLDLVVQREDDDVKYRLLGEVKWIKPLRSESAYLLGIVLREHAASDIKAWRQLFVDSTD